MCCPVSRAKDCYCSTFSQGNSQLILLGSNFEQCGKISIVHVQAGKKTRFELFKTIVCAKCVCKYACLLQGYFHAIITVFQNDLIEFFLMFLIAILVFPPVKSEFKDHSIRKRILEKIFILIPYLTETLSYKTNFQKLLFHKGMSSGSLPGKNHSR